MTPGARIAAAAEILDAYLDGVPAEKALLAWSRRSRFAGSKDRAAVRDHVFQALRCLRSYAALGGGESGRALMLGMLRAEGRAPEEVFTGEGHAPRALSPEEAAAGRAPEAGAEACDMPDWLWPQLEAALGARAEATLQIMQSRAPVFLRANLAKGSRDDAAQALAEEGIETRPHALASGALEVVEGARRIRQSAAFERGLVELQDAASQALVEALPLKGAARVLDYCAGGGGKALAMAALCEAEICAHDISARRMQDIPVRAARAGVRIRRLEAEALAGAQPFDLVLADAPCSGSGAWRRAPMGKWKLDAAGLAALCDTQAQVLDAAAGHVAESGALAYATCSLLTAENAAAGEGFLARNSGWQLAEERSWTPLDGGDGFYFALFRRK